MLWIISVLLVNLLIDSSVSFTVLVPRDPVVAHVGSTVTLPCWISPATDAEDLEIRWYRHENFNNPVLFYHHRKIQDMQEESFRNRSSLSVRSDQSAGLKDGDVSLRLEKLTVQDEAPFHCYVSGEQTYDSGAVELKITALGSAPVLSPKPLDGRQVNVSCSSSGWYPELAVTWVSDGQEALHLRGASHIRRADGLFSVQSWTAVTQSDTQLVSCSVSLSTGGMKEGTIDIQGFAPLVSSDPWKAPFFTVLIAALLGLLGLILYKHRHKLTGKKPADQNSCEDGPAEKVVGEVNIEELRKHAVQITVDRENLHPDLIVSKNSKMLRDGPDYNHTGGGFPFELCAFGAQSFTSGRHYWEVDLTAYNTPPKQFWLIGVVKHGNFTVRDRRGLTPSNGYWFFCSDGPNGFYTNTNPPIKLSLNPRPEQLGILLDYDDGLLSFYNIKEKNHLLTMKTKFSGSVVPLFNPGVGDESPIRILDLPEPEESPAESPAETSQLVNSSDTGLTHQRV